jgi:hypothetical protein
LEKSARSGSGGGQEPHNALRLSAKGTKANNNNKNNNNNKIVPRKPHFLFAPVLRRGNTG